MYLIPRQIGPPPVEPVSLDEAAAQVRDTSDYARNELARCVPAARSMAEQELKRPLISRIYAVYMDAWPCDNVIALPFPQVQSIEKICYARLATQDEIDAQFPPAWGGASWGSGEVTVVEQVLATSEYQLSSIPEPCGRVFLLIGQPTPAIEREGIIVHFKAGFGEQQQDVPEDLRMSVLQIAAHLYNNRESVITSEAGKAGAAEMPMAAARTLATWRTARAL